MDVISNSAARHARLREEELSIDEYLALCQSDPMAYASAAQRMLAAIGEPEMVDTRKDPRLSRLFANKVIRRYPAFAEFYGMEDAIEQVVSFFRHAAQALEERKQILYLLGPVGGGKSSIAERLKYLMQKVPFYALKGSPVNESPLGLFDAAEDGPVLEEQFGIPRRCLQHVLSPWAVKRLEEYGGDIRHFRVVKRYPSILRQVAIAKTEPGDENNQDISSLVGKVDIRKLENFAQDDTDAYSYSGGLCLANQGLLEFVEMFKAPIKVLQLRLFAIHDDARERELLVSAIHDEDGYRELRQLLSRQYDLGVREPNIEVWNVNLRGDRCLTLRHTPVQGRPLADDAPEVLKHVARLWGFGVQIESVGEDGALPVLLHSVPAPSP